MKNFTIMMLGYNSAPWIRRSIESALKQNYKNFQVIAVDANTNDGTYEILKEYESDSRFKLIRNNERKYVSENVCIAVDNAPDDTIMCALDFDDWLLRDDVLSILNDVYNEDIWLTYGNYVDYYSENFIIDHKALSDYPKDIVENNKFRSDRWRATHLRTFKKSLFQKINRKDFIDPLTGTWYKMAGDMGYMFPMLEMAGNRYKFISTIFYSYNKTNPINDDKVSLQEQLKCEQSIRNSPVYSKLESL